MSSEQFKAYNYATTGIKDVFYCTRADLITVGVAAGASDDVDIEVQLDGDSSIWYPHTETLADSSITVVDANVIGVRTNITTNTSGDIDVEFSRDPRR